MQYRVASSPASATVDGFRQTVAGRRIAAAYIALGALYFFSRRVKSMQHACLALYGFLANFPSKSIGNVVSYWNTLVAAVSFNICFFVPLNLCFFVPLNLCFLESLFPCIVVPLNLCFSNLCFFESLFPWIFVSLNLCFLESLFLWIFVSLNLCFLVSLFLSIFVFLNLCFIESLFYWIFVLLNLCFLRIFVSFIESLFPWIFSFNLCFLCCCAFYACAITNNKISLVYRLYYFYHLQLLWYTTSSGRFRFEVLKLWIESRF